MLQLPMCELVAMPPESALEEGSIVHNVCVRRQTESTVRMGAAAAGSCGFSCSSSPLSCACRTQVRGQDGNTGTGDAVHFRCRAAAAGAFDSPMARDLTRRAMDVLRRGSSVLISRTADGNTAGSRKAVSPGGMHSSM